LASSRDPRDQIDDILPAFSEWLKVQKIKWRDDADRKRPHFFPSAEGYPLTKADSDKPLSALPPGSPEYELTPRARTWVGAMMVAVLLIIGMGSYAFVRHTPVPRAEVKQEEDRRAAEAEANRKVEEAEKQRLATEQERQGDSCRRGGSEAQE
jgi:hypothetical protein